MVIVDRIFALIAVVAVVFGFIGNEIMQQISSLLFAVSAGWLSGSVFGRWIVGD